MKCSWSVIQSRVRKVPGKGKAVKPMGRRRWMEEEY